MRFSFHRRKPRRMPCVTRLHTHAYSVRFFIRKFMFKKSSKNNNQISALSRVWMAANSTFISDNEWTSICSRSQTDISLWHVHTLWVKCVLRRHRHIIRNISHAKCDLSLKWTSRNGDRWGKILIREGKNERNNAHLKYTSNEFSHPAPAYVICERTNVARSVLLLIRRKSSFLTLPEIASSYVKLQISTHVRLPPSLFLARSASHAIPVILIIIINDTYYFRNNTPLTAVWMTCQCCLQTKSWCIWRYDNTGDFFACCFASTMPTQYRIPALISSLRPALCHCSKRWHNICCSWAFTQRRWQQWIVKLVREATASGCRYHEKKKKINMKRYYIACRFVCLYWANIRRMCPSNGWRLPHQPPSGAA